MVKNILLVLFIVLSVSMYAQNNVDYSDIKLEAEEDYKKAEPTVVHAADYVLSNPIDREDIKCVYATQFILAWMGGTPDYMFSLDLLAKLDGDLDQTSVYLSSLAKYTLEHSSEAFDLKLIEAGSLNLFLDYCSNPNNKVKQTRKLKKMINAKQKSVSVK